MPLSNDSIKPIDPVVTIDPIGIEPVDIKPVVTDDTVISELKQKILIFDSQDILDRVGASPIIEGGIGAVLIGAPIVAVDGRVAISHPFSQVDLDWFEAYSGVTIVEELPKDFVLPDVKQ
jgi:hypothetical protein